MPAGEGGAGGLQWIVGGEGGGSPGGLICSPCPRGRGAGVLLRLLARRLGLGLAGGLVAMLLLLLLLLLLPPHCPTSHLMLRLPCICKHTCICV